MHRRQDRACLDKIYFPARMSSWADERAADMMRDENIGDGVVGLVSRSAENQLECGRGPSRHNFRPRRVRRMRVHRTDRSARSGRSLSLLVFQRYALCGHAVPQGNDSNLWALRARSELLHDGR